MKKPGPSGRSFVAVGSPSASSASGWLGLALLPGAQGAFVLGLAGAQGME